MTTLDDACNFFYYGAKILNEETGEGMKIVNKPFGLREGGDFKPPFLCPHSNTFNTSVYVLCVENKEDSLGLNWFHTFKGLPMRQASPL